MLNRPNSQNHRNRTNYTNLPNYLNTRNHHIYPNHAKDYFNVNKYANRIEIHDISGRKITQEIVTDNQKFNRNNIANGLYIYRLFNKKNIEIESGKIIFE